MNEKVQSIFPQSGPIDKKTIFEKMLVSTALNSLCIKCCKLELFDVDVDYSQYYTLQNGEDLLQSLPVFYQANSFYYLDEALYQYRINMTSISYVYRSGQHRTKKIIRPLLYAYLEKLGLDSEENKVSFFRFYLSSLWASIQSAYNGISSIEERESVLDELHTHEFVKKGREFLDICNLSKCTHLGLSVFYKHDNKAMNAYMRVYLPVIRSLQGAKATIRKILK